MASDPSVVPSGGTTSDVLDGGPETHDPAHAVRVHRAQHAVPMWRSRRFRAITRAGMQVADVVVMLALLQLPFVDFSMTAHPPTASAVLVIATLIAVGITGGYRLSPAGPRFLAAWTSLGAAVGLAAAWTFLKFVVTKLGGAAFEPPVATGFVGYMALVATWTAASRASALSMLHAVARREALLFVGPSSAAQTLRETLRARGEPQPVIEVPVSGGDDEAVAEAIERHIRQPISAVILGTPLSQLGSASVGAIIDAKVANLPILSPTQLHEELWECTPLDPEDLSWVLRDEQLRSGADIVQQGLKRVLDIVGALVLLVLTSPLFLVAAMLVKWQDGGPIFYRQTREGWWKREFTITKFRTMVQDAEKAGAQWSTQGDPRITRIGRFLRKTRIDELPQLFNVLGGSMALVGPRPERPEFNEKLSRRIPYYDLRHAVKPGVTGWAQVNYRYGASLEDAIRKLEYDVYYVRHAAFWFDIKCLVRTVPVVLGMQGQ